MTTGRGSQRLTRQDPRKQLVTSSCDRAGSRRPRRTVTWTGTTRSADRAKDLTGQRIWDVNEADGAPRGISRRQALTALGVGAGAVIAEQALVADGAPSSPLP